MDILPPHLAGEGLVRLAVALSVVALVIWACYATIRLNAPGRQPQEAEQDRATGLSVTDPFEYGGLAEKRTALRRRGTLVEVAVRDADAKVPLGSGWVFDRSVGGLGLKTRFDTGIGQTLTVRAVNAPDIVPWIEVEVRSCRPTNGEWELGCRFVRTPTYNVLMLFG
jgi:hypothetical protein